MRPGYRAGDHLLGITSRRRGFFRATEEGDLAGLEALLAADVRLTGDGGGKAPALARSLSGRGRVARALGNWATASSS